VNPTQRVAGAQLRSFVLRDRPLGIPLVHGIEVMERSYDLTPRTRTRILGVAKEWIVIAVPVHKMAHGVLMNFCIEGHVARLSGQPYATPSTLDLLWSYARLHVLCER
jgi:hypothetical protein